jgi:hypothetical protein
MSFVGSNILAGASGQGGAGYAIERSLRFNSGDSAYLNRTPSAAGNRKTWTWSGWVKLVDHVNQSFIFGAAGGFQIYHSVGKIYLDGDASVSSSNYWTFATSRVFRDPSAWYHFVFVHDTTEAAANDRFKIYVNGDQLTEFSSNNRTNFTQNYEGYVNNNVEHRIGRQPGTSVYCNLYLADVHFIDGQALAPTDFGELDDNNVWQPKEFEGSYTSSSFSTNITPSSTAYPNTTLSNNNLTWTGSTANDTGTVSALIPTNKKTYVEVTHTSTGGGNPGPGVANAPLSELGTDTVKAWWRGGTDGNISVSTLGSFSGSSTTWSNGDVLGIALDNTANSGAGSITFYKNGYQVWTGGSGWTSHSDLRFEWQNNGSGTSSGTWNFGATSFSHPLSGYTGLSLAVGANSFHLDFADNSSNAALGTDTSGNSNTWTVNNLNVSGISGTNSGNSWYFDGGNNTSITANDSDLALGNGDWTVEMFVKPESGVNGQSALTSYNTNNPIFETDGPLKLRWFTAATYNPGLGTGNWYHVAWVRHGSNGYIYLNGTRIANRSYSEGNLTQTSLAIGNRTSNGVPWKGLISNVHIVVGTALYTGATNNIPFTPITPGSNTKLLTCHSNTVVDGSGNNITLTNNGATVSNELPSGGAAGTSTLAGIDSLVDTPTNATTPTDTGAGGEVVGNYATLNPLDKRDSPTFSNGNLQVNGSGAAHCVGRATFAVSSGKWYWETTINSAIVSTYYPSPGICSMDGAVPNQLGDGASGHAYMANGQKYTSAALSSYGASFTNGDILGFALDLDAGTLTAYKNGASQGVLASGLTGSWSPSWSHYQSTSLIYNFGQRAFSHPVSGYKSLNTANLPEPTIADGSKYFDTKLYTGNASSKAITGYNFSPDFVWIKNRSGAYHHGLFDIVRGANKVLLSSGTNAETTYTQQLNSFDSSGFTLGDNSDSGNYVNVNNSTYVGWAWDAGSSNTTIAAGSLNSSSYDQSQTWSTYGTFTGTNHTDYDWLGVFGASDVWDGLGSLYLTSNSGKWTLSSPIACSSGVKFYVHGNYSITINEGLSDEITQSSTGGANYHYFTIPFSGNIASIKSNTSYAYLMRIFVDGLALIDSGISINTPSIASTVRSSPESGFSIVSYTGTGANALLGHGLNAAPKMIITKNISANASWAVYHSALGNGSLLQLEKTDAAINSASAWNSKDPTSSVFSVGNYADTNNQNEAYIAYCFAPVEGYSAMGKYSGFSASVGPFIYTGFAPKFVVLKSSTHATDWCINDIMREENDPGNARLSPNLSNAEVSDSANDYRVDFLSNGFQLRGDNTAQNTTGRDYIYMAFAENPFKTARAR